MSSRPHVIAVRTPESLRPPESPDSGYRHRKGVRLTDGVLAEHTPFPSQAPAPAAAPAADELDEAPTPYEEPTLNASGAVRIEPPPAKDYDEEDEEENFGVLTPLLAFEPPGRDFKPMAVDLGPPSLDGEQATQACEPPLTVDERNAPAPETVPEEERTDANEERTASDEERTDAPCVEEPTDSDEPGTGRAAAQERQAQEQRSAAFEEDRTIAEDPVDFRTPPSPDDIDVPTRRVDVPEVMARPDVSEELLNRLRRASASSINVVTDTAISSAQELVKSERARRRRRRGRSAYPVLAIFALGTILGLAVRMTRGATSAPVPSEAVASTLIAPLPSPSPATAVPLLPAENDEAAEQPWGVEVTPISPSDVTPPATPATNVTNVPPPVPPQSGAAVRPASPAPKPHLRHSMVHRASEAGRAAASCKDLVPARGILPCRSASGI